MKNKRIAIFTGHFGSGKTEIAVNYAFKTARKGNKTAIADLDIVNPYFRTVDAKKELEEAGIYVLTTKYANTNIDIPALPAEINTLFENKEYSVILDIGGDDLGAKVVSRYRNEIIEDDYEIFSVINTKRPMTNSVGKIEYIVREIEESSRLKIGSFINNTNLLQKTCPEDVIEGYKMISKVSEKTGIPIAFTSGFANVLDKVKSSIDGELFYMDKYIKLPF